jgi:hypothetical protein
MAKRIDLTGKKFGRLTVLKFVGVDKWRLALWRCLCECGNEKVIKGSLLIRERTKSCGCLNKEIVSKKLKKHGMSKTDFYRVWNTMVMRCHNPNVKSFESYGAIGITVSDEWRFFENFKNDMLASYKPGLSLERIDNKQGYGVNNCRWATAREQANNTKRNVMVEYKGEVLTMSEMARKHDISIDLFKSRLRIGWSVERAIETKREG